MYYSYFSSHAPALTVTLLYDTSVITFLLIEFFCDSRAFTEILQALTGNQSRLGPPEIIKQHNVFLIKPLSCRA